MVDPDRCASRESKAATLSTFVPACQGFPLAVPATPTDENESSAHLDAPTLPHVRALLGRGHAPSRGALPRADQCGDGSEVEDLPGKYLEVGNESIEARKFSIELCQA